MEGQKLRAYDRIQIGGDFEEVDHPIHGASLLFKDVIIAREIIQEYSDGIAWKPADELEKAAPYAGPRWAMSGQHPDTGMLMQTQDIHGQIVDPGFVKNLKDHGRTDRQNNRGIKVDLWVFLKYIAPKLADDLKDGKKADVSIGFVFNQDMAPGTVEKGPLKGLDYDYVQRDIFIDHVTFGIDNGRCPMPQCGIGADTSMPMTVNDNALRLLNYTIDRGTMVPTIGKDISMEELNGKIEELKDSLNAKRGEINTKYEAIDTIFDEARDKADPIWEDINTLWGEYDEIYNELLAYREAKIILITQSVVDGSGDVESDEAKELRVRTMYHFDKVEDWTLQSDEFRKTLMDRAPPYESKLDLDLFHTNMTDILGAGIEDKSAVLAVVKDVVYICDKSGDPKIKDDAYRRLSKVEVCWTCLDRYVPDTTEDEPEDSEEDGHHKKKKKEKTEDKANLQAVYDEINRNKKLVDSNDLSG